MAATDHPQRRSHRSNGNGRPRSNTSDYRQPLRPMRSGSNELHDAVIVNALESALVLLPQNEVAERALIGSALIDEEVLDTCSFVKSQYFFQEINGLAWKTLQEMRAAGIRIDVITLMEAFTARGLLDDAGGVDTILAYANGVPHAGHARDYAKIICEKYLSRYSQTVNSTLSKAGGRGDPGEIAAAWTASYTEMQEIFVALGIADDGSRSGPRHRPKTIAEMRKRTRPEWIIPGILQERKRALVFGDSNTGKSFLALDMALCIATGLPWHGRAIKQGPVMYVCAEDEDGIMDRVNLWLDYHHLDDAPDFWIIDDSPNLLETGQVADAIAQIKAVVDDAPMLVIFDTLAASTSGGDENSAQDMGIAVAAIHRVQRECNCSVMVVHHSGKDASKGPRGYSSLRADVDIALEVSADETTGLITMRGNKMRGDDKRKINLGFRLRQFALDEHADFTSCIVEALDEPPPPDASRVRRKQTATDKLLALMQEVGKGQLHGQWCTAFVKAGYGQRATFNRALEELYQARLVECIGGLYRLAPPKTSE